MLNTNRHGHKQECTGLLNTLGWWSLKSSLLTESPSGKWSMVSLWGWKNRGLCSGSITFALTTTQPAIFSPDHRLLVSKNFVFWTNVANLESGKALALSNPFSGSEDRVCILHYELLRSVYATDTPKMWSVMYHRLFSSWLILEQSEDTNPMQSVMHSINKSCCSALVSRWGHRHRSAHTWKTAFRVSFI